MPEAEHGDYLVNIMYALGCCNVSYGDINAWQEATGSHLTPWETETLYTMCNAYTVQLSKSSDVKCQPPYWEQAKNIDVDAKFRALAARKRVSHK